MKKTMSILLFIVCVIALAGCSGNSPSSPSTSEPPVSTAESSSIPSESDIQGESAQQNIPAPSSVPSSTPTAESDIQEKALPAEQDARTEGNAMPTLNIQIGDNSFTATLYDNASTRALLELLPLTLDMMELNGNEKYHFLSDILPAKAENPEEIHTGDFMLYQDNCLVLFYQDFSPSYSYTKLGYMEDVTGLADALGSGSIEITFSAGG